MHRPFEHGTRLLLALIKLPHYGITNSTGAKGPSGNPTNTQTTVNNSPANSRNTE